MINLFEMLISNTIVSAILAIVVYGISRRIHRLPLMHCLWVIVLLKLLIPPLVPFRVAVLSIGQAAISSDHQLQRGAVQEPIEEASAEVHLEQSEFQFSQSIGSLSEYTGIGVNGTNADTKGGVIDLQNIKETVFTQTSKTVRWTTVIVVTMYVWLATSIVVLCIAVARGFSFWRSLGTARTASKDLQNEVEQLAKTIGLKHSPKVLLLSANLSPMVWAPLGRPQLLFPEKLLNDLRPDA